MEEFTLHPSKKQALDSGQAAVLIFLLAMLFLNNIVYLYLAIITLLACMICPGIFRPFAVIWFGLAYILGRIVSPIFLAIIFFLIVTPICFIRKILGFDSLNLKKWKKNSDSVFVDRNKQIMFSNLDHPY